MTALTTRDALKRELQRHIGAHADIVANDLIASGSVIDATTLADDESLVDRVCEDAGVDSPGSGPDWYDTQAVLRVLAAALSERGEQHG